MGSWFYDDGFWVFIGVGLWVLMFGGEFLDSRVGGSTARTWGKWQDLMRAWMTEEKE